jgi:Metallo-peptidase family M12
MNNLVSAAGFGVISAFGAFALAAQSGGNPALVARANQQLGLSQCEITTVAIEPAGESCLRASFTFEGEAVTAGLAPYSVRAPGYQVLAAGRDGELLPVPPTPERTLRGVIEGEAGSIVAASLLDDGLYALVVIGGREYWLQPLGSVVFEAAPSDYVVYRTEYVVCTDRPCGGELFPPTGTLTPQGGNSNPKGSVSKIAQLACDADYEYYSRWGSISAVETRIGSVINTVNLQYQPEVGITHEITTIIVRTSPTQPYTSTDAQTLLNQFRNTWNANHGGVQRDIAELFTGKEINSGTIGIAWVGVVCNLSYAYSVVQSDFSNSFQCVTDLSSHELGHNWSAQHCSCTSYTMNPYITCANVHHPSLSIPSIVNHRNAVGCLTDGGGGGGNPVSIHVGAITPSTVSTKGLKKASVTVQIVNDQGTPVAGVAVSGTLSGGFTGTLSGTTGANGTVTMVGTQTKKGSVTYTFCVTSVSGPLPYQSANNVETCDSF